VDKAREASRKDNILVCERGASFRYNTSYRHALARNSCRETGCPVVFDPRIRAAPGGHGNFFRRTARFVPVLARAAVASGISGRVHGPIRTRTSALGVPRLAPDRMKGAAGHLEELDALVKRGASRSRN